RFNREAANAACINHPNVVQIYDFGETADGILYLAMEFVEGETLRGIIEQNGPLVPKRAAALTRQIADALAAAHRLGIVHRDLKPDNIMVGRQHDGSDWVKVVDFGIAKTVQGARESGAGSQTVTTAGVSLGTPEYMSPEQLAGERLDSRTDQYSLGLVLFNMLTANLPYPGVTSRETLVRRLTSRPETLTDVAPQVAWPLPLQAALDRALAPDSADRYESVSDFASDVERGVAAFDTRATRRFFGRTARLSGATVRIAGTPTVRASTRSGWRAPLIAVGAVLLAVAVADAGYVAYRSLQQMPVSAAVRVPLVVAPTDTVAAIAPQTARNTASRDTAARDGAAPDTAVRQVARTDSVSAVTAPQTDSANTGDDDRVRLLAEEIRGHAVKANQLMLRGDVPRVRAELRDVAEGTQTFRMLYPVAADSIHLEQMVRMAGMRIFQTCQTASADTSIRFPRNFTCEQLMQSANERRRARFGTQGRFGRSPE
ncbi:MAG TPA: serine/threonine-protein kinase, partial [Gemmatimonadaceae bacterium]|nr:serine/threonine-protein kinase [Gemmatimonadaceae bacterium]